MCKVKLNLQVLVFFIGFIYSSFLSAHEQSVANIELDIENNNAKIKWSIAVEDLVRVISLDDNLDGLIKWQEILNNRQNLQLFLERNVEIFSNSQKCLVRLDELNLNANAASPRIQIFADYQCFSQPSTLTYSFMQKIDHLHVAYLELNSLQKGQKFLLKEGQRSINLKSNVSAGFGEFVIQGVKHILIGYDHLAFLIILFFSAKIISKKNEFYHTLLIYVSNFTLAHSITLMTSSLGLINLPSWFVETVIAVSVVYGAIIVIIGHSKIESSTVFGFGLIHGLGFATVLNELTGNVSIHIDLLFAFNLGVEIGQIIFLAGVLLLLKIPLQYFGYSKVSKSVATIVLLLGCYWTLDRVMGAYLV